MKLITFEKLKTLIQLVKADFKKIDDIISTVKTNIDTEASTRLSNDTALETRIAANESAITTLNGTGEGSVSKTVADKIAEVVSDAPADLDTLKEISDWISGHESDASAMNTAIQTNKTNIETQTSNLSTLVSNLTSNTNKADTSSTFYQLFKLIYPVGSLYWSSNSTNPADLFGGTWTQIKDRFVLACGDTYKTAGATGGASAVTLTVANMPSHNHTFTPSGTITMNAHTHTIDSHSHTFTPSGTISTTTNLTGRYQQVIRGVLTVGYNYDGGGDEDYGKTKGIFSFGDPFFFYRSGKMET